MKKKDKHNSRKGSTRRKKLEEKEGKAKKKKGANH